MSSMLPVTIWTIASAALTGMMLALLGTLKLALARRPQRVTAVVSWQLWLLNIALLPLLLGSGLLVDFIGFRLMMIAGPSLLSLSLLILSIKPAYPRTHLAVFTAAAATTMLATTSAALMPRALFGEAELVPSFLFGMGLVGLGALVSAPLVDLMFRRLKQRQTMGVLAMVTLVPAFLAALPPTDAPSLHQVPFPGGLPLFVAEPAIWLGAAVFFFYAPLEGFVSVWTTNYISSLHDQPKGRANALLFGFWAFLILSRFAVALTQHSTLLRDLYADWFLIFPALGVAVILGNLAAAHSLSSIRFSLCMLGIFMGPLLPLVVGQVFAKLIPMSSADELIRVSMPATAYATLCAVGSLGGLVLSPVVRFCARAKSFPVAFLIPMFVALLLAASAVVFALQPSR